MSSVHVQYPRLPAIGHNELTADALETCFAQACKRRYMEPDEVAMITSAEAWAASTA